jgi:hypothetical protein
MGYDLHWVIWEAQLSTAGQRLVQYLWQDSLQTLSHGNPLGLRRSGLFSGSLRIRRR